MFSMPPEKLMINLLHSAATEAEIAAILAETAGRPALPALGDAAWGSRSDHPSVAAWLPALVARAESEAGEPLPPLPDGLYADFFKTGVRLPFENVYFERRRRLGRAAMALLFAKEEADRGLFLRSFLDKLGGILDEESWALPAHVWTDPSGKDPMQIDLFAAETANTVAELLVVFRAVIPDAAAQRIKSRLRTRIFENYADRQPPFHWTGLPMNWNAVCHQGVVGSALTIEDDHALVARLLVQASRFLPVFLDGFGNDGSTSEGPAYWSYGFGWFSELNAQLEHRTRGALSLFEGDAKIGRIARFAPLLTFSGGHFVNFSDGGHDGRLGAPLLAYLGERLAEPAIGTLGAAIYRHQITEGINLDVQRCDFFFLSRLVLRAPDAGVVVSAQEPVQPDAYFADYGAVVARGTDGRGHFWEFSAKGGHNDEHHNHNDCGSFLLNIDGAPALIEIGAPEYVHDFFAPATRYQFLAARSLGHSVPLVNGIEQGAGREFSATVIGAEVGGDRVAFTVDLTGCYPASARCRKLHRSFVLEKSAGRLVVSDTYELDAPGAVESILMVRDPVVRKWGEAHITTPAVSLRVVPRDGTYLGAIETCPYRGHRGTDEEVFRLRFSSSTPRAASGLISYETTVG